MIMLRRLIKNAQWIFGNKKLFCLLIKNVSPLSVFYCHNMSCGGSKIEISVSIKRDEYIIMDMTKNKWLTPYRRLILGMVSNGLLLIMEIWALCYSIPHQGSSLFEFYTIDSNILCLIASTIYLVFGALAVKKKSYVLPLFATILRLMASTALALTFIVVVTILCPMGGPSSWVMMLFHEEMIFHHLLCPIISIVSFLIFEVDPRISFKETLYPLAFTLLYAIPILILNITRTIEGPYPFLRVYEQPWYLSIIYMIGICGFDYLLSFLLYLPSRHAKKIK